MFRPDRDRLCGHVEIDETYVGGYEAGLHGRQTHQKAIVVIAVEILERKGFGRVRMLRLSPGISMVSSAHTTGKLSLTIGVDLGIWQRNIHSLRKFHVFLRNTSLVTFQFFTLSDRLKYSVKLRTCCIFVNGLGNFNLTNSSGTSYRIQDYTL